MSYATATMATGPMRLGIWSTIGQSFSAFFANFGKLLLINLVAIPFLVIVAAFGDGTGTDEPDLRESLMALIAALVVLLYSVVSAAAMQHGIVGYLQRGSFAVGAALGQGLKRFLPFLLTAIVLGAMAAVGAILLVVPMFVVLSIFYVAGVACTVEGKGVFASLSRGAQLSRGHRWRIFWTLVVTFILIVLIAVAGSLAITILAATQNPLAVLLVSSFYSVFATTFYTVLSAVMYVRLTAIEGGTVAGGHNPVL